MKKDKLVYRKRLNPLLPFYNFFITFWRERKEGSKKRCLKLRKEENSFFFPTILLLILQLCRSLFDRIFYNLFVFNKLDVGTFIAFMIA